MFFGATLFLSAILKGNHLRPGALPCQTLQTFLFCFFRLNPFQHNRRNNLFKTKGSPAHCKGRTFKLKLVKNPCKNLQRECQNQQVNLPPPRLDVRA